MVNNGCYNKSSYLKKQKASHLGDKNSSWKGGNSYKYNSKFYIPIMKTLKQKCSICGTTEKLVTHHIDWNYKNNKLENITIVCRGCHNKIHKTKRS